MMKVATSRKAIRLRLPAQQHADAQHDDAESHDPDLGDVERDKAEHEAQQAGDLAHGLDEPDRPRVPRQLFHGEVVEERLPDLEAEVEQEVREDDEDQQAPVFFEDVAHGLHALPGDGVRCEANYSARRSNANEPGLTTALRRRGRLAVGVETTLLRAPKH